MASEIMFIFFGPHATGEELITSTTQWATKKPSRKKRKEMNINWGMNLELLKSGKKSVSILHLLLFIYILP